MKLLLPLLLCGPALAPADDLELPEITATAWLGHVGEPPQLDHYRGRAVLVHFFSTDSDPKIQAKAHWQVVRKHYDTFAEKGVVFLGVSRDSVGSVKNYMVRHNIPFPVAAGCDAHDVLGGGPDFYEILFDRKGERYWEGPANGLWNGKLLKGSKGSDRPGAADALALHVWGLGGKPTESAVKALAEGDLKGALAKVDAILARSSSKPEAVEAADAVRAAVEEHVALLLSQIEALVVEGEVLIAHTALEELADQLKKHELGAGAVALQQAHESDPWIQKQLVADERFAKLMSDYWRVGFDKTEKKFQDLVEELPVTLAARKARNHLEGR